MANTVFISPGVYTREQDFTFFASRIGITRLALVGLTVKGPAFEPTKTSTTEDYFKRFGSTDTSLQLPYVANTFLKQSGELTVTRILGLSGFTNSPVFCITASGSAGANVVVATIRPKLNVAQTAYLSTGGTTDFKLGMSTGGTSPLSSFVISATTGPLSATVLTVSLDESQDNYIVKALGKNPKNVSGDYGFYVDRIYPHYIRQAAQEGSIAIINPTLTIDATYAATNFTGGFTNAKTPYVVGQVVGSTVRDLFRFQTISDGNGANSEIKISIANIDLLAKSFDVYVRYYNDTDSTSLVQGLERFRACSMDSTSPNFIAKMIGTTDESYPRKSNYITVDMADSYPENVLPAGFRGYSVRRHAGTSASTIYYKKSYLSGDTVAKTYLGLSELGYTAFTVSQTAYNTTINTLETDMFVYNGSNTDATGYTTVKGFHMESVAPTSEFEVGVYSSLSAYTKSQRKFTLVPSGGYDGWTPYVLPTFTDSVSDTNYVNAFKRAVDSNASPDETDFNIFATPGINFYDNENSVKYALTMVETRADALYIIDSPRISSGSTKGTPDTVVTYLQDTGIDSSYAATYWPWLQMMDANYNKYVYISPTAEVVKAIALTDNVAYPWFAPAGINRGTMSSNIASADVKLTKDDRDTLYEGRINPIATFIQQGIVIYGQKTLQLRPSALDRINIRRLVLQVRRLIAAASQAILFEPNDQSLKDQFLAKVEPILLQVQNQRGLAAFRVSMEDQNNAADEFDRNTLRGKVQIKPTYAVEFIDLTFQVLPNGANFDSF